MRKEVLLKKKEDLVKKMTWYFRDSFDQEDIKSFSIAQLETLLKIAEKAESTREKAETFHGISANEVIHCGTGKIIYVSDNGEVSEESENEVMEGASCNIYRNYKERIKTEKA